MAAVVEHPIIIDPVVQEHIPLLRPEELAQLEANLKKHGCRDPLVVWKGKHILLDGHHRKAICDRLGIPYEIKEQYFRDLEAALAWVDENQLGRRNLTSEQMAMLRGRIYGHRKKMAEFKKGLSGNPGGQTHTTGGQHPQPHEKTAQQMSRQFGVTERTIRRDGAYAEAVSRMSAHLPELASRVRKGDLPARGEVEMAARLWESHPEKAKAILMGTLSLDKVRQELEDEALAEQYEPPAIQEAAEIAGEYDVIVIDAPWPDESAGRLKRQGIHAPTMSPEELAGLKLPCAADCHVWLWTPQKFLPAALGLLEKWALRYCCTFVWQKPGGASGKDQPQMNCELALYARKGNAVFADTAGISLSFQASQLVPGRKPERFYQMVRQLTTGRRLDLFSRQPPEGFSAGGQTHLPQQQSA